MKQILSLNRCDLHIHTAASDGVLTATGVVNAAADAGLQTIAITDHDTLDGVLALPASLPLRILPGIELGIDMPDDEVHILGLDIDPANPVWLQSGLISKLKNARLERVDAICSRLRQLGYPVSTEEVLRKAPPGASAGRLHIAETLLEKRLIPSIHYAFKNLIGITGPAYAARYKLRIEDAVAVIECSGGIPVIAHPGLCKNQKLVSTVISAGIKGLEVFYPRHTRQQTEYYLGLCNKYNLFPSGGSDFHGKPGRYPAKLGQYYCMLPQWTRR